MCLRRTPSLGCGKRHESAARAAAPRPSATPARVDILTGVAEEAAAPAPAAVATHLDFVQNDENAGPPAAKKARTDA